MEKIRIGIVGYGNLGKGVELALTQNPDFSLVGVFTRREPASLVLLTEGAKAYSIDALMDYQDQIDLLILCGGSATDLPEQAPELARHFNTVDSFDTHAKIPEYFKKVDQSAREGGHFSLISVGWDPGMFSLNRLYASCLLPHGTGDTFWGRGISQGHSDAIRRVNGVLDAKQYTIPVTEAVEAVRAGTADRLTARQKHLRECFVVAEEGADLERIRKEIETMPNYFADYDTTVHFISQEELDREHSAMPHGGFVIRTGKTGGGKRHTIEYALKLDSNPEFTSSVLIAFARAAYRMYQEGKRGAGTVFDLPPAYLSPYSGEELRRDML